MKQTKIYQNKYFVFYWALCFDISYQLCGYFDNRPRINLDLFFFSLTIILPFRNKWTDECDSPKWGIAYHNATFWIYRGGKGNNNGGSKWWAFYAPWSWQWHRTSALRKDGTWETENRKFSEKQFYNDEKWAGILFYETHPYSYVLNSGEVQNVNATIKVEEREWRLHWFHWLPISKKRKIIDVEFDNEVGEGIYSWKGGTIGCDYEMKPKESPFECLKRMEKERKFTR
jgi:hypothetical protein